MTSGLRRLILVASLTLAVGCSVPVPQQLARSTAPGNHGCADRFARALASPGVQIPGAFACQTEALQRSAHDAGVNNDADLQSMAQRPPVFTSSRLVGQTSNGFAYELDGPDGRALLTLSLARDGRVAHFNLGELPADAT